MALIGISERPLCCARLMPKCLAPNRNVSTSIGPDHSGLSQAFSGTNRACPRVGRIVVGTALEWADMSPCFRRAAYLVFCIGLLILLSLPLAFAQSDLCRISGFIKDPSGATIPDAKVTVRNNSRVERQATTNESGYYIIT